MHTRAANKFLGWFGDNYNKQKAKLISYCKSSGYTFNEDIFSDTALKIYDKIVKSGIDDPTPNGYDKYFFKSFKTNLFREQQYSRVAKLDDNYEGEVDEVYDEWYNKNNAPEIEKLRKDLWIDYSSLYLINKVVDNWDNEHVYLFKMKTFIPKMTYKKLQRESGMKNVRQKVVDVRNWLRENVTKDEIKKAFNQKYGFLLE